MGGLGIAEAMREPLILIARFAGYLAGKGTGGRLSP